MRDNSPPGDTYDLCFFDGSRQSGSSAKKRPTAVITVRAEALPKVPVESTNTRALMRQSAASQPALISASGNRSLGAFGEQALSDLGVAIAEIAVERAKKQGLRIVEERLQKTFCSDSDEMKEFKKLFPRTCRALQSVRLADLAGTAKPFLDALTLDLIATATTRAVPELKELANQQRAIQQLLLLSFEALSHSGTDLRARSVEILAQLAEVVPPNSDVGFALRAVIDCRETRDCTPSMLRGIAAQPDKFFDGNIDPIQWDGFAAFVTTALRVLDPPAGTTQNAQARDAIALSFDAFDALLSSGPAGFEKKWSSVKMPFSPTMDPDVVEPLQSLSGNTKNQRIILQRLKELALAAVDEDLPKVVAAARELLEAQPSFYGSSEGKQAIRRMTRIGGAVGAYLATYSKESKSGADEKKVLREQRKQAVEAVIDEMTDRVDRGHEWVASLMVRPGMFVGGHWQPNTVAAAGSDVRDVKLMPPQLELPLGVALQYLPGRMVGGRKEFRADGFHTQISFFDAGQFLSYQNGDISKPTWASAFMIGAEVGWLIGTPDSAFVLAGGIRYAPALFSKQADPTEIGAQAGAVRFGFSLGYSVPLLDFN